MTEPQLHEGAAAVTPNDPIDPLKYEQLYEQTRTRVMTKMIPVAITGTHALDVGSGPGHYSRILAEKGWAVTAIDTDPSNIELAKRYATSTYLGDAISILEHLAPGRFELVLLLEIIEHMSKQDARSLLRGAFNSLKRGGILLLSTPNRHSPAGLGGYYWGEKVRGWGRWTAGDSTHVHIYTSREIIALVRASGFSVRNVTGYWYQGYMPLLGRWRLPIAVSHRWPLNRLGYKVILECVKRP